VTVGDSIEAFLRLYSTLLFIIPFACPFSPPDAEAEPLGSCDRGRRDLVPIEGSSSSSDSGLRRCVVSSIDLWEDMDVFLL
jgi:hypothetical protein